MRSSSIMTHGWPALLAAATLLGAMPAAAQQANASSEAVGMGNNFAAKAQGVDAVAWNPAMIGIAGSPTFSLNIAAPGVVAGLDPVSYTDLVKYMKTGSNVIPDSTRHLWLNRVTTANGEHGDLGASLGLFGVGLGHVAFQVSSVETMRTTLNPDAFEAIMFGNAGSTGSLHNLNFAGSNLSAAVFTTGAVSVGIPLTRSGAGPLASGSSVGITAKYILGNGLLMGRDNGSAISSDSVDVNFPIIHSNSDSSVGRGGSGVGLDLGYAWRSNRLTLSGAVQNVVNTFKWDTTKLVSRSGTASFNGTTNTTDFDETLYSDAPASLKSAVAAYVFKPALVTGGAYELNRKTTLTADFHDQLGTDQSVLIGPKMHFGVGVDARWIPFIPLRAGVALETGGWMASGGIAFAPGPLEIGIAGVIDHRNGGTGGGVMASLFTLR